MEKILGKLLKTAEGEPFEKAMLKELFAACKTLPANINLAFTLIISKMDEKKHSQLRLNGIELINILFQRSMHFQSLILQNSQTLLRLCLDEKLEPKRFTALLERRIVELITTVWVSSNPQLKVLRTSVLEKTKSRKWLDQSANEALTEIENPAIIRSKQMKYEKYKSLLEGFCEKKEKILHYQTQLAAAIDLILPQFIPSSSSATSSITVPFRGVLEVQINNSVTETTENSIVFDAVRENLTMLRNLNGQIDEWLQLASGVDHNDLEKRNHETFLKELIDLKIVSLNLSLKAQELLDNSVVLSDSDEEFEEVDMDAIADATPYSESERELSMVPIHSVTSSTELAQVFRKSDFNSPARSLLEADHDKQHSFPKHLEEFFKIAPVVEYGEDLQFWSKKPSNITFDQLSKHGGLEFKHRFLGESSSSDKYVSEEALENLMKRTIYVEEKPFIVPEYSACKVLGKNGKLCERRDMERCPFHGLIKPRNELGKLLSGEDESSMIPIWQQIEAQVYIPEKAKTVKKHTLETIPKKKLSHSQRLMKRSKKLLNSGNNSTEVSLKERDRQVFRW